MTHECTVDIVKTAIAANSIDWFSLFAETRQKRALHGTDGVNFVPLGEFDWFVDRYCSEVPKQLEIYITCLFSESFIKINSCNSTKHTHIYDALNCKSSEKLKLLVMNTRYALRFALLCLSMEGLEEYSVLTKKLQNFWCFSQNLPKFLVDILSCPKGDKKCRLYTARLLNNLVTCNYDVAKQIISDIHYLTPSEENIRKRIFQDIPNDSYIEDGNEDDVPEFKSCLDHSPNSRRNWLDVVLNCVRCNSRDSMGALVACLHNIVCSLMLNRDLTTDSGTDVISGTGDSSIGLQESRETDLCFPIQVASCQLFISTLIRQVISISVGDTATKSRNVRQNSIGKGNTGHNYSVSTLDEGSEWILILISKLCRLGLLETMYTSVGQNLSHVLPEQLILLHIVQNEIDNVAGPERIVNVFGEGSTSQVNASHLFLCSLYTELYEKSRMADCESSVDDKDNEDVACEIVLEILSSTLGSETFISHQIRYLIGTETIFLQQIILNLSEILDRINQMNEYIANRTRDFVFPEKYQNYCTLCVRVIGTLCYQCTANQDLLRETIIPTRWSASSDDATDIQQPQKSTRFQQRNGLHVLLSTTSISHSCFTLREWSVLAIRYALENNTMNQTIVQELETQHAVQSSIMSDMGLKVEFDTRSGKATIQPSDNQ